MAEQILKMTDSAEEHLKDLLAKKDDGPIGMRLTVKERGCSGMAYAFDYAYEEPEGDEVVKGDGVTVFVDPAVIMYIIGTEMDWEESQFTSGFVFRNPNEKGRCGCGESFHI